MHNAATTLLHRAAQFIPNPYKLPLRGQRVLITGGASGIGRLMALECAQRNAAKVEIWDLSEEGARAVVDEIESLGVAASYQVVDVTDQQAVEAAAEHVGDIDILINNAGIVSGEDFLENPQENVDRTFAVNVRSLYLTTRAFLPGMIRQNSGTIVTIASAAGLTGVAKQTDYSPSKFAAVGFAESLRVEMKERGHRVNSLVVCPFYINTGMFEGAKSKAPWLLPVLEQEEVAVHVIDAIEAGRHQLVLPWTARVAYVGRLLPVRAYDAIAKLIGTSSSMDEFVGRKEKASK
ncbi:SDR family oxidoreductase [Corynebacterium pseudopelargi]|uniref:3-oxoacyl-[acyl-carrier-protein] reductase FabG n=1 Tax=Corynebacterium pseudopelargi TaxID=2080757 RepID=A0A3G6IRG4_9CORY|nr:SDR family oxidoreductase [Corynebacterium pseudopelargi]AZA08161.1 3-oxoacyl-[acyl-carrier-protein] reductase FabG [Corynebacterium pseudopelargi]